MKPTTDHRRRIAHGSAARRGVVTTVLAATALAGCSDSIFGGCEIRLIEATLPATWSFAGVTAQGDWFGRLAETNLEPGHFHAIADAFEDADEASGSMSWLVPAFDTIPGYVAARMPVPVEVGTRLPVRAGPVGGYDIVTGTTEGAQVDARLGDFQPTEASGEIEVLATDPLRLRLDVTFRDAGGRLLTVAGTATFRVFEEERSCF